MKFVTLPFSMKFKTIDMKNIKHLALCFALGLFAVSCSTTKELSYDIEAKSNTQTGGTVTFKEENGQVTMRVHATGLTPGLHAMHLHEIADCSADDAMSTGGHWNPTGHDHGRWEEGEFHMGDIGNLNANAEGVATLLFITDKWCIGCNDETRNILNKSVIIHADADDFHTQPTGNAGGRVGCVEIK